MFIDTHCHIDDEKFSDKDAVYTNLVAKNVIYAINMSCNNKSIDDSVYLAEKYERVYFGAGIHPSDIEELNDEIIDKIIGATKHKKCVAIGEIGLDYHFEPFSREKQVDGFIKQLEIASSVSLPVSIHCRDATGDMLNILKDNKSKIKNGAIMHCFSGSVETARELIKMGVYISFGGTLTFKNAKNLKEVAKDIPNDFILTETDSPYLSPEPYRGRINEPQNVSLITEYLAFLRNTDVNNMATTILNNTCRIMPKLK
ncbi:MAG: TatD family hydrolase [Clostridia bacterium]|nr:TatD family hydrolase [Clostridia bacterium]